MIAFKEKLEGALYGLAIGDAMGAPVEGWPPERIAERFDDVKEFLPVTHSGDPSLGKGNGRITDDTLMAEALIRAYVRHEDHMDAYDFEEFLVPEIAETKIWIPEKGREMPLLERLYWPGKYAWMRLVINHAEPRSAGIGNCVNCGVAMYMMPVGALNAGYPDAAYQEAASLALAENESYAVEAAAVSAAAHASAFSKESSIDDVLETAARVARDGTEGAIRAVVASVERGGSLDAFVSRTRSAVLPFVTKAAHVADDASPQSKAATDAGRPSRVRSIEELPVALGALKYGGADFSRTLKAAVFYGRDCDTIAGMACSLFGAVHGVRSIREDLRAASDAANRRDFKGLAAEFAETISTVFRKDEKRFTSKRAALGEGESS